MNKHCALIVWVALFGSACTTRAANGRHESSSLPKDVTKLSWAEAFKQETHIVFNELADQYVAMGCIEVTPQVHGELYQEVQALAKSAKIDMPRVLIIPRQSFFNQTKMSSLGDVNAFATASPDNAISLVCVGESLVNNLSTQELKGLLAHEISHVLLKHIARMRQVRSTSLFLTIAACVGLWRSDMSRVKKISAGCLAIALSNLINAYDQRCLERQADLKAVGLTGNGALGDGLERLELLVAQRRPFSTKLLQNIFRFAPFLLSHPATSVRKAYIKQAIG